MRWIGPRKLSEVAIGLIVLASSDCVVGSGSVMVLTVEWAIVEKDLMELLLNFDLGVWCSTEDLRSFFNSLLFQPEDKRMKQNK